MTRFGWTWEPLGPVQIFGNWTAVLRVTAPDGESFLTVGDPATEVPPTLRPHDHRRLTNYINRRVLRVLETRR